MTQCPHTTKIGDNYGMSCKICGEQLSGYGYRAQFKTCIHSLVPFGEDEKHVQCQYCEMLFESGTIISSIRCQTAGKAVALLSRAIGSGLKASYHPNGGMTCKRDFEITHTVYLLGNPEAIREFSEREKRNAYTRTN